MEEYPDEYDYCDVCKELLIDCECYDEMYSSYRSAECD